MRYVTIINNRQFEIEIQRDGSVLVDGVRVEVDFLELEENLHSMIQDTRSVELAIEEHGGKYHPGPTSHLPENAEHKFRDPYGIVFDISTHGWDGAKQISESSV